MPAPDSPRRSWFAVWRWKWWVWGSMLTLIVLYPLSAGPVHWLYYSEHLPPSSGRTIAKVYYPLEMVLRSNPHLERHFDDYCRLWYDPPPVKKIRAKPPAKF